MAEASIYQIYGVKLVSDFAFENQLERADGPSELCIEGAKDIPCWDSAQLRYESSYRLEDGRSEVTVHVAQGHDVITFTDIARFFVYPNRITYQLLDNTRSYAIEILLLGTVLSLWLERRGLAALHTAAVVVEGKAVGFLASNKGGKTSLAASFMQGGYPLLSDDIVALESSPEGLIARPGYPQMRMWPEQVTQFLGHYEKLTKVHPYLEKRRVPVGREGFGCFQSQPVPLGRLYLPERGGSAISITPLSFGESIMALMGHSFILGVPEALGLEAARFKLFSEVVQHHPVCRLVYPDGMAYLPAVRDAILADTA